MKTNKLYKEVKSLSNETRLVYNLAYRVMSHNYGFNPYTLHKEENESIVKALAKTKHYPVFERIILKIAIHYHFEFTKTFFNLEEEWQYWKQHFETVQPWKSKSQKQYAEVEYSQNEMEHWDNQIKEAYFTDNQEAWNDCWY